MSIEAKQAMAGAAKDQDILVLGFWDNAERWTLVTSGEVVSMNNSVLNRISLDQIEKTVDILQPTDGTVKKDAEYIALGASKVTIWVPSGAPMFGLVGVLKMFPMAVPGEI